VEWWKKWSIEHKEHRAKYQKKYIARNIERIKATRQGWRLNNIERCRTYKQKREAVKRRLKSTLSTSQWEEIKASFSNLCAYCGEERPLQREHFISLSKSGEYSCDNIIPACAKCNQSKGSNSFFDWFPRQLFYSKKREGKILMFLNYRNGVQQLSISALKLEGDGK
jgi:5-methylcytosine-specific restriction endonuclease McrA